MVFVEIAKRYIKVKIKSKRKHDQFLDEFCRVFDENVERKERKDAFKELPFNPKK